MVVLSKQEIKVRVGVGVEIDLGIGIGRSCTRNADGANPGEVAAHQSKYTQGAGRRRRLAVARCTPFVGLLTVRLLGPPGSTVHNLHDLGKVVILLATAVPSSPARAI